MAAAAIAVGAALSIYGNYQRNMDARDAELANADFYNVQAARTAAAHKRKLQLLAKDQRGFQDKQRGMFAKAGISLSGSALEFTGAQYAEQVMEYKAAEQEADWDVRMAQMRAGQSRDNADKYGDPMRNLLQAGGTALTAYGAAK